MRFFKNLACLAIVASIPQSLAAQQPAADTQPGKMCWWKPTQSCTHVIITEASLQFPLSKSTAMVAWRDAFGNARTEEITFGDNPTIAIDIGFLSKAGPHLLLGPTAQLGFDGGLKKFGLRARRDAFKGLVYDGQVSVSNGEVIGKGYSNRGESTTGISMELRLINPTYGGFGLLYDNLPWPKLAADGATYTSGPGRAQRVSALVTLAPGPAAAAAVAGGALYLIAATILGVLWENS